MEKDILIVISSYPPKGTTHGEGVGGVASFAKSSLLPLSLNSDRKMIVLAEILDKEESYEENGILVIRCWRRDKLVSYLTLWEKIHLFGETGNVLVQFEFALFGGLLMTSLLPLFLLFLKLSGKKVFLVAHQVLTNLKSLSGHLGLAGDSILLKFYSLMLPLYYQFISLGSERIIVLAKEFEKRLINLGIPNQKIITIYHGVDNSLEILDQNQARKKLKLKQKDLTVLVFGFLTWYKGSDLAVHGFAKFLRNNKKTNVKLILAGGESLTQRDKDHYKLFISNLRRISKRILNVQITGFVPEKKIPAYFSAADLVVLPYRTFMSSSGVLSLALSFGKPVLLSTPLKKWFSNGQSKFLPQVDFFEPNTDSLARALNKVLNNKNELEKLAGISKEIKELRDYGGLAYEYDKLFIGSPAIGALATA